MKRIIITIITLAALMPSLKAVDFETVVSDVLANNLQIRSDSASAAADIFARKAENNLEDPEIGFNHLWGGTPEHDKRWGIELTQSFDFPGVYAMRRKANAAAADASHFALRSQQLELAMQTRLLLVDAVNVNQQARVMRRVLANVDSLLILTRRQLADGNATILTLKKMQLERFYIEEKLTSIQIEQDQIRQQISALNGGKLVDTDALADYPVMALLDAQIYESVVTPSIQALDKEGMAAQFDVKAERMRRVPGFSVGYVHEFEDNTHFNGFSVGLAIPVFSTNKSLAAAKSRVLSADIATEAAKIDRLASVRATYAEAQRLKRSIDAYHSAFGNDDYLTLLRRAYDMGQLTVHEYLGEVNEYLQLFMEHLDVEHACRRALVSLNAYL